jgi:hypothetical protein
VSRESWLLPEPVRASRLVPGSRPALRW